MFGKRVRYKDISDVPLYPVTKTNYKKVGGKWQKASSSKEMINSKQTKWTLDPRGLPGEKSHRHFKTDRSSNEYIDTFESVAPGGKEKTRWFVDFRTGNNNKCRRYNRLYHQRQVYKSRKR